MKDPKLNFYSIQTFDLSSNCVIDEFVKLKFGYLWKRRLNLEVPNMYSISKDVKIYFDQLVIVINAAVNHVL
jgi:hypothetical protein